MQLSNEYLVAHGFGANHPDRVLKKYYKHSMTKPEWRLSVTEEYIPMTNKLAYNIDAWRCAESGAIIKRASIHMAETVEELEGVTKLCGIDV